MFTISIDSDEGAARTALASAGIESPGPLMIAAAQSMLDGAEEALSGDPDVEAGDISHELADSSVGRYSVKEMIGDTPDLLDADDEGLAGPDPSPREKITAALYAILSRVAALAIEDNRPDASDVDWEDAHPSRGYVTIGKTADGFIHVRAELREREQGTELSLVGEYRHGGGQIVMSTDVDDIEPAPDWDADDVAQLWAIWDRWHLNGMNAACAHQRRQAAKMGKQPHEVFTTSNHSVENGRYTRSYTPIDGKQASHARSTCAICSRAYGSTWLFESLPADVVSFIVDHFPAARDLDSTR